MQNEYIMKYLPQALSDLNDILDYIIHELKNPIAADNFADEFDEKTGSLTQHPFIGALYKLNHKFDYEYRQLFVGNYTVFYAVIGNVVEVHRVIYTARSMDELV